MLVSIVKKIYPPKGLIESRTQWGPFDTLPFYCDQRTKFDTFNLKKKFRRFRILNMFHPPKGFCESRTQWDAFDTHPFQCCQRRMFDTFNLETEIRRFEMVQSQLHPKSPLLATTILEPSISSSFFTFFAKNVKISVFPYYIRFYRIFAKTLFYTIIYDFLGIFEQKPWQYP